MSTSAAKRAFRGVSIVGEGMRQEGESEEDGSIDTCEGRPREVVTEGLLRRMRRQSEHTQNDYFKFRST